MSFEKSERVLSCLKSQTLCSDIRARSSFSTSTYESMTLRTSRSSSYLLRLLCASLRTRLVLLDLHNLGMNWATRVTHGLSCKVPRLLISLKILVINFFSEVPVRFRASSIWTTLSLQGFEQSLILPESLTSSDSSIFGVQNETINAAVKTYRMSAIPETSEMNSITVYTDL